RRADVEAAAHRAAHAALVRGRGVLVVRDGVDERASGLRKHGGRGAAVVAQRLELRVALSDLVRCGAAEAGVVRDPVVAVRLDGGEYPDRAEVHPARAGEDAAEQLDRTAHRLDRG